MAKDVNSNKKGFYRNTISKRKTREIIPPLLNRLGPVVNKDVEISGIPGS